MDYSYNLPCEPPLSNSILKNRPTPIGRTKMKRKKKSTLTPVIHDLDDNVPFDVYDSTPQLPSIKTENDDINVVFRRKMPFSSNRNNNLKQFLQENHSHYCSIPLNPSDAALFYVTSSTLNENSMPHSSPDQSSSSEHEENDLPASKTNQRQNRLIPKDNLNDRYLLEPVDEKPPPISTLIDDFSNTSINNGDGSARSDETTDYLDAVRENSSNCRCADCDSEFPTIAIMSWLLVICKKCADVHRLLTWEFLHLQSLITTACDYDLIDLLRDYGNQFSNSLLESNLSEAVKPNANSSQFDREDYIRKKYLEKMYLRSYQLKNTYTQEQLNKMLYENVETADYKRTLHLIMLGANPNYSEKMFAVADHAKRYQQIKQMKLILANGGFSEYDLTKTNFDDINETTVYLSTKHGVLKGVLTRYENDRLKVYSLTHNIDKHPRCLFEIDLNNILTIYNQSVNAISLKCRLMNPPIININSQCTLIVDEQTLSNEYLWVFPNELERSLWIREIIKRQYSYNQLIYSDFILLTKINIQEGINAEKQQVIVLVYSGRFVICSDTIFDEVDLRKYSSLTYQRSEEFTGVVLCLVSNRFLYLSSPILKLTDILYSSLRQALKVKTLTDLNNQILTSQNIPVIVERFISFIFKYGLQTKGIYRQAGQETKIKQLLNECLEDPFNPSLSHENYSEHDVASALKRFLRQLETPLLGTRQNYNAWLRSTVDNTVKSEKLIQYYRALLRDLKRHFPIHYSTLRTMLIHIQTVAMLADRNGMTLSNLVSTFAPCLVSHKDSMLMDYDKNGIREYRKMSLDDIDMNKSRNLYEDDTQDSLDVTNSPLLTKLKRNQSFHTPRHSITSISSLSQFPLSSSYVHVTPSIQADLEIMSNLCKYYRELFDITDDEMNHERTCIESLISVHVQRKLDGKMISVYFESRADELNGYAMNTSEETTADTIIDKLLRQVDRSDCFFWALFEVIIDQNLERPMYSCENISDVLYRYKTYLSHDLNRQATFVVKLNYIQFENERLHQRQQIFDNQSVQCEYFHVLTERWIPCVWIFEKAVLQIHRITNNNTDRTVKWKSQNESNSTVIFDQQSLIYSWSIEEIYLYIGADCRIVSPFDMNEYRILTILPPENLQENDTKSLFGISFRFTNRHQMFSWYLELVHNNGHDKWTRRASHTIPDGVNYLPLQNYHTLPSSVMPIRKKSEQLRSKLISKSCHIASNFCKQLRK